MNIHSVLKNATKDSVRVDPFPHLIIENALDAELYSQLEKEYPFQTMIEGNSGLAPNIRYQLSAVDGLKIDSRLSSLWREFIEYHTSNDFFGEVYDLFSKSLYELYPHISREESTGVLYRDKKKILLDCQPGVNTPTFKQTSVKIAHLDNPTQLFAGLLYFRDDYDNSLGGDLEIYKYKNNKYKFYGHRLIKSKYIETVNSVPYKKNTLVLFINSINSLHGVTPRSATKFQRRLVNFIGTVGTPGDFDKRLFHIPLKKKNIFVRSINFLHRKFV